MMQVTNKMYTQDVLKFQKQTFKSSNPVVVPVTGMMPAGMHLWDGVARAYNRWSDAWSKIVRSGRGVKKNHPPYFFVKS